MSEHLSDQQIARVEALEASARLIGTRTEGAFKGTEPRDVCEMTDLSEYILNGTHPMERYHEELSKP